MASSTTIYPHAQVSLINGTIDLDTDTIKAILLNKNYTYSTSHQYVSDVIAYEHDGSGYTRQTVSGKAVSFLVTGAKFDASDATFSSLAAGSVDVRYVVLYKQTGGNDSSPEDDHLICLGNLGADVTPSGQDLVIQWDGTNGIFATT